MSKSKICKQCGEEKQLDSFYVNNTYADGYTSKCKKCILEYHKQYRKDNVIKLKNKQQEYYRENKERMLAAHKEYYNRNKKQILKRNAEYREKNRESINQYFRDRYKNNRREILDSRKDYNEKHREEKKAYLKKYYRENKERLARQNYERQRKRVKSDPMFKLKRQVGLLIWRSFNQRGQVKPARSEEILGCKMDEFTAYLKQTWFDKYHTEWDGHPCHIDHITPLATAKTPEDIKRLCHYTNLRLLTPEDNMAKGDKILIEEE